MKANSVKALTLAAVCAAAGSALPITAAPSSGQSSSSNRMSSQSSASATSSDRRIDFGKPVRFVKNAFTREDAQQSDRSMSRSSDRDSSSTHFWNRNDDNGHARSWSKDHSASRDEKMKKEEKQGFFTRLMNWRPFNRDRDQ
jgi:hypothetical protein